MMCVCRIAGSDAACDSTRSGLALDIVRRSLLLRWFKIETYNLETLGPCYMAIFWGFRTVNSNLQHCGHAQ
jgi:hypothetical protein